MAYDVYLFFLPNYCGQYKNTLLTYILSNFKKCQLSIFSVTFVLRYWTIPLSYYYFLIYLYHIYFSFHYLQLHCIQVIFISITNLIIPLFNIFCAFMLYLNNAWLQFTDIILCVGTGVVPQSLIWVHDHAVLASATIWLTRVPVCIVQGCPITPLPGSLHTHTSVHQS